MDKIKINTAVNRGIQGAVFGFVCWNIVFIVARKNWLNRKAIRDGSHFVLLEKKIQESFSAMEARVIGIIRKISGENCLNMPFSFIIIFFFLLVE